VGFGCVFLLLLRETVWKEHRADNPLFPNIHEKIDESLPRYAFNSQSTLGHLTISRPQFTTYFKCFLI
jgi:hypothetical protein